MEYTIDQILDWELCGCGRSYCVVFDGGIGEYAESLSKNELLYAIEELKKDKHLKKSSVDKSVKHIEKILGQYKGK